MLSAFLGFERVVLGKESFAILKLKTLPDPRDDEVIPTTGEFLILAALKTTPSAIAGASETAFTCKWGSGRLGSPDIVDWAVIDFHIRKTEWDAVRRKNDRIPL